MAGRCECARACSCCTQTTDSIGVVGSGGAGSCYSMEVRYSTDAGNRARAGGDGGVFADACLLGPDGEPIAPNEDGCQQLPAACILDYNGDPIAPSPEGCVQLPTNGAPPEFGCGLTTDEDGVLLVSTGASWPLHDLFGREFADDYASAGHVICDPDGVLRVAPQSTSITAGDSETVVEPDLLSVPDDFTSPSGAAITLTNPSTNRYMLVARYVVAMVDVVVPPVSGCEVTLQERVGGGSWADARQILAPQNQSGTASIRSRLQLSTWRVASVDPGDGHTLELRVKVEHTDTGGAPVLISATVANRLLGVTQ